MVCACVKTWTTCWSWSVLLATHSNSTVLHFDSLSKPDLSWPCGPVAVQSLTQSLSKIQWDPLFRLFACCYVLCFLRNQHTYPKSFTIVWSSMLHHNILTFHFFVLMSYITIIFILNKLTLWPLSLFSESKYRTVLFESAGQTWWSACDPCLYTCSHEL